MRFVPFALCAAALVACSDANSSAGNGTTAPVTRPGSNQPSGTPSVGERLQSVMSDGFGNVTLPPDEFSHAADAVHPDLACPPSDWNGARCWLLYTPYKNSDPRFENPAMLFLQDDTTWKTPADVVNPLVPYPGAPSYNSDPDHAYDPVTGRLVQIFRVVTDSTNDIMIMSTGNVKRWTQPRLAFSEPRHDAISPAIVIENDRTIKMWYVSAGPDGCSALSSRLRMRTAQPGPDGHFDDATWSNAQETSLAIPGYVVWHLDVTSLGGDSGYAALIAAYKRGTNCANSDLWFATSDDGITWRPYAVPIFWRGMPIARDRNISTWYRGTMRYDAATDSLDLWPSAYSNPNWNVYHVRVKLVDLLALLRRAAASDVHPTFDRIQSVLRAMP